MFYNKQKVFSVFIISLACIVAVWFLATKNKPVSEPNTLTSSNPTTQRSDLDTDGDGLEDWLEILIGTDPYLKDTDGDGTDDGQELAEGRDPRIKGPNDKNPYVMTTLLASNQSGISLDENTTITEQISKDFLGRYLMLKQSGGQINPDQAEQIAQLSLDLESDSIKGKTYQKKDIKISSVSDKNTRDAYLREYNRSLIKNLIGKSGQELFIFEDSIKKDDLNEIKKLDPIIEGYKAFINDMEKVTVPNDISDIHLEMLNKSSLMLAHIESLRGFFNDPVKSFISLKTYSDVFESLIEINTKLDSYFRSTN